MIRLAHETSAIEVAWAAYDAKMLELVLAYRVAAMDSDLQAEGLVYRMQLQVEADQLLSAWRELFYAACAEPGPGPAA